MSTPSHWLHSIIKADDPEGDDKPGGASLVIASTSGVDRQDDIVEQDWDVSDYAKNPVILWAHRYDIPPLGKALGTKVEDGRLMAAISWDEDHEMGKQVARQVRGGFLNAVSVGFYPGASIPRRSLPEGDPRKAEYGYVHTQNKLLEISVVPVPANAEAIFVTRGAEMFGAATIADCLAKGLPVPGRDGELLDLLLREVPARMPTGPLLERLLSDEGLIAKIAAAIRSPVVAEREEPEAEPDPLVKWWSAIAAGNAPAAPDADAIADWFAANAPE